MNQTEFIIGENKNIEYKRELPADGHKYMKTVVAFANTAGGKIIFGVEDKSLKVCGIDESVVFDTMDAITNAIADSCEPAIIPDISLKTIDGKTIIVVDIAPARQRPYYIKSLGIKEGTYIRVAGTTRKADKDTLKELMLEGSNKSFDQLVCPGLEVSDEDIDNLCEELYSIAVKNCQSDDAKKEIKKVTKSNLITWGVLAEENEVCRPTYAYALLTGDVSFPTKIQCGVFKGKTRSIFVDKREFSGPIHNQIEEAYQYVLAKINLGAKIEGLYRQDIYEMPVGSIREIIANAITHRSYIQPNNVQVALYDDRLEVTSPGMLLNGVTIEKIKAGYSKVRNRAIANAFAYMKIIEEWGSGIPRMFDEFSKYGLEEPELIDMDCDFRVNFYRNNRNVTKVENVTKNVTKNVTIENELKKYFSGKKLSRMLDIVGLIEEDSKITVDTIAGKTGVTVRTIKRDMDTLREYKIVERQGSNVSGSWRLVVEAK